MIRVFSFFMLRIILGLRSLFVSEPRSKAAYPCLDHRSSCIKRPCRHIFCVFKTWICINFLIYCRCRKFTIVGDCIVTLFSNFSCATFVQFLLNGVPRSSSNLSRDDCSLFRLYSGVSKTFDCILSCLLGRGGDTFFN